MAMPVFPQSVADFIAALTDEDFINGGHRTKFIPSVQGGGTMADYCRLVALALLDLADQVAADAASAAAGSGTEASIASIRAAADVAHYLSMRRVVAANAPVTLARAATTTWDMDTGINFDLLLDGNITDMANPANQEPGRNGVLRIRQDATGGRTIGSWGSHFQWVGGGVPNFPTAANAELLISYFVWSSGLIYLTYGGDDQ